MQPSESEMIRPPKITKNIKYVGQSTFADIGKCIIECIPH